MSDKDIVGCGRFGPEELLLFAHGELEDGEAREHVKSCPACRSYVDGVSQLRALTARAGEVGASDDAVEAIMMEARSAGLNKPGAVAGSEKRPAGGRPGAGDRGPRGFRLLAPSLAAMALVAAVALAIWISGPADTGKPGGGVATSEVPDYIASAAPELLAYRLVMESGGDSLLEEDLGAVDEIEADMADLEESMSLGLGLSDGEADEAETTDGGGGSEFVIREDLEMDDEIGNFEIPLMPGLENGVSL